MALSINSIGFLSRKGNLAELKCFPYAHGVAEAFSFLDPLLAARADLRADFVARVLGVPTSTDKEDVLTHLRPAHEAAAVTLGFETTFHAEQVHGCEIAIIGTGSKRWIPEVDGLLTNDPGILLGIHVADCGAVYLADQRTGALGLLHSGKKGTELDITGTAIARMSSEFGTRPEDVVTVLAPCIRPPHYEVNFAITIREQALAAGVSADNYHDCELCTGTDLNRFYSYRLEKGNTGRMLALLGRCL